MRTPFNTGKVQIGIRHEQRRPSMSRDEEFVQALLIGGGNRQYLRPWVVIALLIAAYALVSCVVNV